MEHHSGITAEIDKNWPDDLNPRALVHAWRRRANRDPRPVVTTFIDVENFDTISGPDDWPDRAAEPQNAYYGCSPSQRRATPSDVKQRKRSSGTMRLICICCSILDTNVADCSTPLLAVHRI